MMGKLVSIESRGTLFGALSLFGSIGVLLIDNLGGYLFDKVSNVWPFLMTLISYSIFTIVLIYLGFSGKLNV